MTLIIEDVCVPPERIAEAAKDLQALLGKHGFLSGVAGHASAGNLHFLLTPNFGEPADLERYDAFMHELVELIVDKYDGSLKAEHGTGVNMAPFVEREWGAKATEMMWRVKQLADPDGILGPGVVLNRDPEVHLRNLKIDARDRGGRHQVRRVRLLRAGLPVAQRDDDAAPADRAAARDGAPAGGLARASRRCSSEYEYDALADLRRRRLVQRRVCPVAIDTGKLVKELRRTEHGAASRARRARRSPGAMRPSSAPPGRRLRMRRAWRPHVSATGSSRRRAERIRRRGRGRAASRRGPPGDARRRPAPTLPATTRGGRGGRVPAGVHQPDLRQPARRRGRGPDAARGAGRGLGARRPAAVDPRRRRRPLLRCAVELEGFTGGHAVTWPRKTGDGAASAGATAAGCRS